MKKYILQNGAEISVDFEKGEIAEISRGGRQINEGRAPLFSVKIRKKTGKSLIITSKSCQFKAFDGETAYYAFSLFDAQITVKKEADGLAFRIRVHNKTQDLLEWTELASFSVRKTLKDEADGKGEIVYPYNEGCLVTNMAYRESMPFRYIEPDYPSKNTFSIFPNMIFTQFIAYVADGAGVYLGMHDEGRTTKHIDFCYADDGIKILTRAFCDVGYGEDYQMPFDTVLRVFDGAWQDGAEIYRKWFTAHLPQGLVKIDENKNLPAWYAENPLIVAYPLRGVHDTDTSDNGLYPYKNALPYLEEIASQTDGKVMALLMHWESTAPWVPPYSWPPYGGEKQFGEFTKALRDKDMLVGLYCSGFGWTQRSNVDLSYSCEDKFEEWGIGEHLCVNSNGELASTICKAQREGFDFCPASAKTKEIFKQEFDKICAGGVDYVQALDQNHGGGSYFCYSDKHKHVPAPGKWQQEETNKLLSSIDKKGVLLGCESAAAEPFLAQLSFSDNRYELNYYLGTPTPIYAYLYHEYLNNFMGNQICAILEKRYNNFTYRLAYSFTAGDMLTVVMNGKGELLHAWCDYVEPKEKNVDKGVALSFIKTLNAWRTKAGKNFLHKGKMVKPAPIACGKEKFRLEDGITYLTVDEALTCAYEYGGKVAQFIVNYNENPVKVGLDKKYDVYIDADATICETGVDEVTLTPYSVVMIIETA